MLAAVLGCKSSEFLPATVTRPGFVGCFSCLWLPRVVTIFHPSCARSWRTSRTFRGARGFSPNQAVESLPDVGERVREQVAVRVERDVDRRVAELRLEELWVRAGSDHQRGVRVAEIMEAKRREIRAPNGGAEDTRHEVVLPPKAAPPRGEHDPELVRRASEELLAEDAHRLAGEANLASTSRRLRGDELPVPRPRLNDDRSTREVESPTTEGEQLALAKPGQAGEADEVSVGLDGLDCEPLDLVPVEEAHLGPLPARRPHAQDRLVDHLAALPCAAQDHL